MTGQLLEHLRPEDLAFDGQPPPLVVAEQDSVLPKLLSEDSILRQEILDGVLPPAIDSAGQDQEHQVPWLKLRLYVPRDARWRSGSTRDRRVLVKRAKHVAGGLWQESWFQPLADRLTLFTLRDLQPAEERYRGMEQDWSLLGLSPDAATPSSMGTILLTSHVRGSKNGG